MSTISEKLKSIYGSDNTYTILELLREMIDALKDYEGVIVKNISLSQTDSTHAKFTIEYGNEVTQDWYLELPPGVGIDSITIEEVK